MSVAETLRRVQDAEAEAAAILAAAEAKAEEEIAAARREAARILDASGSAARDQFELLKNRSRAEEAAAVEGIESAARVEMAEIRSRATRNSEGAKAVLAALAARLTGGGD